LSELYYAGSHGMDIKGPSSRKHQKGNQNVLCQPAKEFLPMMTEVHEILLEKIKGIHGANVENNKFCLSVHFRCVDEENWEDLADRVKGVLKEYPKLRLTQGRKVLEIRPTIKWDKGKAIEFLLESLGYANSKDVLPIYIGDDRTDEDAFKVLRKRGQGFGILVSKIPKETQAVYSLQEPSEHGNEQLRAIISEYRDCMHFPPRSFQEVWEDFCRHASLLAWLRNWFTLFFRPPRGGVEQEQLGLLCSRVAEVTLPNMSDCWFWTLEALSEFTVKSTHILIDDKILLKLKCPLGGLKLSPSRLTFMLEGFVWTNYILD
nr:probable trehalose-phosphate phosphatase D [Tanacetum cinerariifolium]